MDLKGQDGKSLGKKWPAKLTGANFAGAKLIGTLLSKENLSDAARGGADLSEVSVED